MLENIVVLISRFL